MIGIKLQGRLGNQMFQYALIYTLSKKKKELFYLVEYIEKNRLSIFKLKYGSFETIINKSLRFLNKFYISRKNKYVEINNIHPSSSKDKLIKYSYFEGFFQSSIYFDKYKTDLIKLFTVRKQYNDLFLKQYTDIFQNNKTIVIHIRRGDYINWNLKEMGEGDLSLPFKYYENFLTQFNKEDFIFIFISDEIDTVEKYFGHQSNYIFSRNSEEIDLQILINGDILCLSNSTFSWWGAYLNQKPQKVVYAPKYWLGFKIKEEFPKGILEEDWNLIEVNDY